MWGWGPRQFYLWRLRRGGFILDVQVDALDLLATFPFRPFAEPRCRFDLCLGPCWLLWREGRVHRSLVESAEPLPGRSLLRRAGSLPWGFRFGNTGPLPKHLLRTLVSFCRLLSWTCGQDVDWCDGGTCAWGLRRARDNHCASLLQREKKLSQLWS